MIQGLKSDLEAKFATLQKEIKQVRIAVGNSAPAQNHNNSPLLMRTATGNDLVVGGGLEAKLTKMVKSLEERTKSGFGKVKTEFVALTTSVQQT